MLSFLTALSLIVLILALNQIDTDNPILHNHPKNNPFKFTCSSSHETYNINSDSILGNYTQFAVAVDNAHCSTVGKEILLKNGSAVDAAIASGLCNGVMNAQSAGIGGGFFMVIYLKSKNKTYVIDAREKAPINAHKLMFMNQSSSVGGLSTGIPGEIYGYWQAHKIAGRLPWKKLFEPTIRLCREGFRISKVLSNAIKISEKYIRSNRGLSQIFLNQKTNQLYQFNDIIKMPNLADTLEILSHDHINAFYDSDLTKDIVREINENGGNVTLNDFKDYKAIVKDAIYDYIDEDYKLITAPVPSNGILVSFILKLMRGFNLSDQTLHDENESLLYHHRLVESFKHAFAYRSLLGDEKDNENITKVIRNLRDRNFIDNIREKIVDFKTFPSSYYGMPHDRDNHGTAHISVLSPEGDAVSLTSTINSYFGGKYVGEKTGIIYNNQMDDFSTPNMSNLYGIAPSEANFIKPGKRPLSTMSPVIIVDKKGFVRLVIGASGGSKILTAIAQVAIKNLWLGKNIKEAIDDRRIHHQLLPNKVLFESDYDTNIQKNINQIGHEIDCFDVGGSIIQAISTVRRVDEILSNCDTRKGGSPDGI